MWHYNKQSLLVIGALIVVVLSETGRSHDLTACQHLRRAEMRRSKALGVRVRTPRCNKIGQFEKVQCQNEKRGRDCWCVDEYGIEIPGTRTEERTKVRCKEPENCPAASCRMFCPAGFARDPETGCTLCRCRDVCDGIQCPRGQACHLSEVKCKDEPCPPVATCKKARSLQNYCAAGMPLAIENNLNSSERPFLCGSGPGKPQCPPLYKCIIETGNDYGVCCPKGLTFQKPGVCPKRETESYSEQTGYICGMPCSHDLECANTEKCCYTKGCQYNCQQPHNITACQQARAVTDLMAINEREGRGYIPNCNGPGGMFSPRQCSRNGLVCWCVDPNTGHKIPGTMGAAKTVNCDGWENMISRSMLRRSFDKEKCDKNICAAVCEYGFKTDQHNCPTCECSEPCEGYQCPNGTHCKVIVDPLCDFGSSLCSSLPICETNLLSYSNLCEIGAPLADSMTNELIYCNLDIRSGGDREFSNTILCPSNYTCTQLVDGSRHICCPVIQNDASDVTETSIENHVQTMCEYLRDFSLRMEGTEEGMKLAVPPPRCNAEGQYNERQCAFRKIKVTRAEQRKILEENTVRRMRMLLTLNQTESNNHDHIEISRSKRNVESLKLYRVDDKLLKVQSASPVIGRSAKVIDMQPNRHQGLGQLFETNFKKVIPGAKRFLNDNEIVDLEVEECWCVDNFGTEIPRTRGFNVTDQMCHQLRESIGCLDLTCRMGCEYGFTLDTETRCPACQCRDPCQGVVCGELEECRLVEVSCHNEYCPPVPACLPRKPGQCPYLVPPGPDNLDTNACAYECKTDAQCTGARRCCSNGCGTQCVLPQMKTACQHLQSIQMHQSSELGIPVMKMNIAQCNHQTGQWNQVQCSLDGYCWCVDRSGRELGGTRTKNSTPTCEENSAFKCKKQICKNKCENGYKMDQNGCPTCECHNFCNEISCASNEECQLIEVECVDAPCPKMPICVPKRASVCAEGSPLKQNDTEMSCGPHDGNDTCPTTHTCQLNPVTKRGVCCTKTRDVCFESVNNVCLAKNTSVHNATLYRFSPKANRCVVITIDLEKSPCQTKNTFQDEISCNSVCPVLTQCERLKLKNTLAAQRTGHSSVWFKPRCDPITGHWSPVQCLAKQPELINKVNTSILLQSPEYGVCWCADKKGAPLKGTLTRDKEPTCSNRQSRHRVQQQLDANDILLEELIRQMTALIDDDNEADYGMEPRTDALSLITVNDIGDDDDYSVKPINLKTTRCRALADSAPFPIACDENGAFIPTQCNQKQCWCVDTAGNQLDSLAMFDKGSYNCSISPISTVIVELYLQNITSIPTSNIYDIVTRELQQLLGNRNIGNLRVQEYYDGSSIVHFELNSTDKVDVAFAMETMILEDELKLIKGQYRSDITRSQFIYQHLDVTPVASRIISHEGTIQFVLFITASCSAFLICVLVVYFIVKRRQQQGKNSTHMFMQNCTTATTKTSSPPPITHLYDYYPNKVSLTDEFNDFPSPIFVLNPEHDLESIRPPTAKTSP